MRIIDFNDQVQAQFGMISYSQFLNQLPSDVRDRFIRHIVTVTGNIGFPIDESSVRNGNKYLQEIFDNILKELSYERRDKVESKSVEVTVTVALPQEQTKTTEETNPTKKLLTEDLPIEWAR